MIGLKPQQIPTVGAVANQSHGQALEHCIQQLYFTYASCDISRSQQQYSFVASFVSKSCEWVTFELGKVSPHLMSRKHTNRRSVRRKDGMVCVILQVTPWRNEKAQTALVVSSRSIQTSATHSHA